MPCSAELAPSPGCSVCGSPHAEPWKASGLDRALEAHDLQITDDRYGVTLPLVRCTGCRFIYATSADVDSLTELYAELDDPGYEQSEEPRRLQMRWLIELAEQACPDARSVLDVGAASGLLVAEARERGLDACGIEPSAALCTTARAAHGVDLVCGTLPHPALASRRFDVVFLVDVVEHVADPVDLLSRCSAQLAPNGVLIVVTPDVGSIAARVLRERWWHFRLAHVGYFDASTLARALERVGLETIARRRAKWFFTVDYLAARLERYLPVAAINRRARASRLGRRLYDSVTPLDLHDSWLFVARRPAPAPDAPEKDTNRAAR